MCEKIEVVYDGPYEGFYVPDHDLTIERGKKVLVPVSYAQERMKHDKGNWEVFGDLPDQEPANEPDPVYEPKETADSNDEPEDSEGGE